MSASPSSSSQPAIDSASFAAAHGALLGAAVGDSCGSYLEFQPGSITPQIVDKALTMPGGGIWRIAAGQLTDDTELALCLAHGLVEAATFIPNESSSLRHGGLPASCIARWYSKWIASGPFDCGRTCSASMGEAIHHTPDDDSSDLPASTMTTCAARYSMDSKANGALMRLTPLPICYHRCTDEQLAELAAADARLSHPSPTCQLANALYTIAIASLIRQPHDRSAAMQRVTGHLQRLRAQPSGATEAVSEVEGWLAAAQAAARGEAVLEDARQQAGFVKHAFTLAFCHLASGSGYEQAVRHVLLAGGDTDTNAAIVGGLVGAAVGAEAIPAHMTQAVLQCKPLRDRPQWLYPSQIPDLVDKLYHKLQ
ncbi:hypothetical protein MMC34_008492 [Xylographa carneopallida]|nr:hypothetical protein [Xylographa carneopallida]